MGKLSDLRIRMASPQVAYYPGQAIAGDLVVELNASEKIKSIWIQLIGSGYCSEEKGSGDDRRTKHYGYDETLVEEKTFVFGFSDSEATELPAGKHVYSFSFNLPEQFPSSFNGSKRWIHYLLQGKIISPETTDREVKTSFFGYPDLGPPSYSAATGSSCRIITHGKDVGTNGESAYNDVNVDSPCQPPQYSAPSDSPLYTEPSVPPLVLPLR